MSEDDEAAEGLPELEQLLVDHFVLGLMAQLRKQFANVSSSRVEDAVLGAVERLVKRLAKKPVRNVRAYLATSAYNDLNKYAKRQSRRGGEESPLKEQVDEPTVSAEAEVMRTAAIEIIKSEIRTWTNANIREVMLIYVDVIAYNEPLDAQEVADLASVVLGEEIAASSVRTWKLRGLKKLKTFIQGTEDFGDYSTEEE